jgi:hypothetical protein
MISWNIVHHGRALYFVEGSTGYAWVFRAVGSFDWFAVEMEVI